MEVGLGIFNSGTSSAVPTIPEFTMKTGIFLLIVLLGIALSYGCLLYTSDAADE